MNLPDVLLTKKDFDDSKYVEILSSSVEKDCHNYNDIFSKIRVELSKKQDVRGEAVFSLLSAVSQFHFKPESPTEPFAPLFEFHNSRGLVPEDFTENNLKSLEVFFGLVKDNELLARVSDILWIRRRNHKIAKQAVVSYLESAKVLEDPQSWTLGTERIERALRIAATLRDKNLLALVFEHIETTLKKYDGNDPLFFSSKLMDLLLEFKRGNTDDYIKICQKISKRALIDSDWDKARTYLELESKWHGMAGNSKEREEALLKEAEAYVSQAKASTESDKPSYLKGAIFLNKAIEAYRKIGGKQDIVESVHKELLRCQEKISAEMKLISKSVDLTKVAKSYQRKVKKKSFLEAIQILGLSYKSPDIKKLKDRVEGQIKKSPMQFLVSRTSISPEGKTIARGGTFTYGGSAEENENVIRAEMFTQAANIDISLAAQGVIQPMRIQIAQEHSGSVAEFMTVVRNNRFIPEDRELIYAKALSAGLRGELMDFLSLVVPQIENSIRYVLYQNGIPSSGINDEGIQYEYDLNQLLFMPEVRKIFGEDLTFDLQGLLVVQVGSNIRNRFAHGLMGSDEFFSPPVLYFWWLTLRIIVLFELQLKKHQKSGGNDENR